MWNAEFWVLMILGTLIYFVFTWANFVDFVGILLKILPLKPPSDYKEVLLVRKDIRFMQHKSKWTKYYLVLTLVYALSYVVITIITRNYGLSFILSLFLSLIVLGVASNFESKQRNRIETQIKIELNINR